MPGTSRRTNLTATPRKIVRARLPALLTFLAIHPKRAHYLIAYGMGGRETWPA